MPATSAATTTAPTAGPPIAAACTAEKALPAGTAPPFAMAMADCKAAAALPAAGPRGVKPAKPMSDSTIMLDDIDIETCTVTPAPRHVTRPSGRKYRRRVEPTHLVPDHSANLDPVDSLQRVKQTSVVSQSFCTSISSLDLIFQDGRVRHGKQYGF